MISDWGTFDMFMVAMDFDGMRTAEEGYVYTVLDHRYVMWRLYGIIHFGTRLTRVLYKDAFT